METLNKKLRKELKMLKAITGITYKDVSQYIEVRQDSLYAWLGGRWDFSYDKCKQLEDVINNLWED